MDKKTEYRKNRNIGVWAGIGSLILARITAAVPVVGVILWVIGVGLVLWGSWSWAKYKGRSGWWTLWGLLAPIGFIALALMQDRYIEEHQQSS